LSIRISELEEIFIGNQYTYELQEHENFISLQAPLAERILAGAINHLGC
jgi:hypothetical protein